MGMGQIDPSAANVGQPEGGQPQPNGEDKGTPQQPDEVSTLKAQIAQLSEEKDKARGYAIALTQQLSQLMEGREQPRDEIPPDKRREVLRQSLEEEPEETLDAHFQQRLAPFVQKNNQTLAIINKERAVEKIGTKEWNKYKGEIEQFTSKMDAETMASPGAWENAYHFVRSQHLDDIVNERVREALAERDSKTQLEGSSSHVGATRGVRPLSTLEQHMAKEFNMTDEEWRKYGRGPTPPTEGE